MKCANCNRDALYQYSLTNAVSILYCDKCLPKFLEPMKKAGNLKLTPTMEKTKEEAIEALSTSKKKAKEAEPINEGNS